MLDFIVVAIIVIGLCFFIRSLFRPYGSTSKSDRIIKDAMSGAERAKDRNVRAILAMENMPEVPAKLDKFGPCTKILPQDNGAVIEVYSSVGVYRVINPFGEAEVDFVTLASAEKYVEEKLEHWIAENEAIKEKKKKVEWERKNK